VKVVPVVRDLCIAISLLLAGWTLKFAIVEWRYRRIHRHLPETHVQQRLSLKSKHHDANADENGNMVTPIICGVVAAEGLVAARGVRTRGSAHRNCCIVDSLATCQHRIGQELAARRAVVNGAPGILTDTLDVCDGRVVRCDVCNFDFRLLLLATCNVDAARDMRTRCSAYDHLATPVS
jgi:hypothetical protein